MDFIQCRAGEVNVITRMGDISKQHTGPVMRISHVCGLEWPVVWPGSATAQYLHPISPSCVS